MCIRDSKLGGMEISDRVHPDLNEKVEALGQNSEELYENLNFDQFEVSPNQSLEENEQLQSDDQNSSLERAKVAKRPTFLPDSTQEVDLEDEISSIPVLEGFEPIEGDD